MPCIRPPSIVTDPRQAILFPILNTVSPTITAAGLRGNRPGIERDRRFIRVASGNLVLSSERDYSPGTGYTFDRADVHQPIGADPRWVSVALHFLVHESPAEES